MPAYQRFVHILVVVVFMVCAGHVSKSDAALATSTGNINMRAGTSHTFTISGGTGYYKISSSDNGVAVATISGSTGRQGKVSGISTGSVVITIEDSSGDSVTIDVQVSDISVSKDRIFLVPGATETITVESGAEFYQVVSQNPAVAGAGLFEDKILITAVSRGETSITVSDSNSNMVKIQVTVGIDFSVDPVDMTLVQGDAQEAELSREGTYVLFSSDTAVATASVTDTRVTVTGTGPGTAVITIRNETGYTADLQVTVTASVSLTEDVKLGVGQAQAVVFEDGSGFYGVDIGDPNIAAVSMKGNDAVVTGLAKGETQIVITDNTGAGLTIQVTVSDILLDTDTVTVMVEESVSVNILSGSDFYNVVSGSPQVAFASVAGDSVTITGVSGGTAVITVTDSNNDSADIAVTVRSAEKSQLVLAISETAAVSLAGGSGFFQVDAANPGIATVILTEETAIVTAHGSGTSTITITDSQGKIFAYEVLVQLPAPVLEFSVTGTLVEMQWDSSPSADAHVIYYALPDAVGNIDISTVARMNLGALESLVLNLDAGIRFFAALQAVHAVHPEMASSLSNIVEVAVP